jgi:hypothetical protein
MRPDRVLAPISLRGLFSSLEKPGYHAPRWLTWSLVGEGLLVAWLAASAVTIGKLVDLVNQHSPTSIFRTAAIPALLAGLILTIAAFRVKPRYVPILVLFAAAFIPFSLPTGTESRLVISLALTIGFLVVWVARSLITERSFSFVPSPINKPLVAFSCATVVSLGWGIALRDPGLYIWPSFPMVQLASGAVMIMLPVALLMVVNFVDDTRLLKVMVALMLVAGVLGLPKQYRLVSAPVNTDGLYTMWIVALSFGQAFFNRKLPIWLRGSLLLLGGLWVYWGFGLNISWVAGWLPVLFCIGLIVFLRSKPLFICLFVAVAVLVAVHQQYYLHTVIPNEENQSLFTRMDAWTVNWSVTKNHLLFGTGPAGYAVYYVNEFPNRAMASHNNFLDVLSQTGIVGMGLFMWFFIELGRIGLGLLRRLSGRGDFEQALAVSTFAGTLGALIMMGFGDWVIPFAYTQTIAGFAHAAYTWLFMGAMVALSRVVQPASERSEVLNAQAVRSA